MVNGDIIKLSNMCFFGYHGPRTIEREVGQHYQVDVSLHLNIVNASHSDDIAETIDYTEVHEIAREIITKTNFKLIETIAERIAERILDHYAVSRVDVAVRKLKPAIRGIMDHVEIKISREKIA
ncbi:dihydroneopterin aldolase [candidate division KSB1 bacterium]